MLRCRRVGRVRGSVFRLNLTCLRGGSFHFILFLHRFFKEKEVIASELPTFFFHEAKAFEQGWEAFGVESMMLMCRKSDKDPEIREQLQDAVHAWMWDGENDLPAGFQVFCTGVDNTR